MRRRRLGRTRRAMWSSPHRARWMLAAVFMGVGALTVPVLTAANSVATSHADDYREPITVNDVKPNQCDGITLDNIIVGDTGDGNANLLLDDDPGTTTMDGRGGADCIVGGSGDDRFREWVLSAGDWCVGGPGNDTNVANRCDNFDQGDPQP